VCLEGIRLFSVTAALLQIQEVNIYTAFTCFTVHAVLSSTVQLLSHLLSFKTGSSPGPLAAFSPRGSLVFFNLEEA
jgi:hypothetical protein